MAKANSKGKRGTHERKHHVPGKGRLQASMPLDHPRRCIAHTPRGTRCRRLGAVGTEPPRCQAHGGAIRRHGNGPGKSRYYSRFLNGPFKQVVASFEDDPNLKDLRGEIAIARSVLMACISDVKDSKSARDRHGAIDTAARTIGSLVERLVKIEDGLKLHIDIGAAKHLVEQLVQIVNEEVKSKEVRKRIADRVDKMDVLKIGAAWP